MECSWKTVLLLVCASLGVQYTAIRTLRDSLSGPCQGAYHCQARHHRGTPPQQCVPQCCTKFRHAHLHCYRIWTNTAETNRHILLFKSMIDNISIFLKLGEGLISEERYRISAGESSHAANRSNRKENCCSNDRSLSKGFPKNRRAQRNEICEIHFTISLQFISINRLSQGSCSLPVLSSGVQK